MSPSVSTFRTTTRPVSANHLFSIPVRSNAFGSDVASVNCPWGHLCGKKVNSGERVSADRRLSPTEQLLRSEFSIYHVDISPRRILDLDAVIAWCRSHLRTEFVTTQRSGA